MSIHEENPVMISTVKVASVAAGSTEELPIFVAPFDCFIRKIYFTNDIDSDGNMTISFQNKGAGGDAVLEIASLSVTSSNVKADLPKDVGALHKDRRFVLKGTAVTYLKALTTEETTHPIFSVEFTAA